MAGPTTAEKREAAKAAALAKLAAGADPAPDVSSAAPTAPETAPAVAPVPEVAAPTPGASSPPAGAGDSAPAASPEAPGAEATVDGAGNADDGAAAEAARAAALALLVAGGAPVTSSTVGGGDAAPQPVITPNGVVREWGGSRRMLVVASRFNVMVNGQHSTAQRGDVVLIDDKYADRGVKLGVLAPAPDASA
ncbi:hypothetical protein [Jiangella muralis]|uniref:hypothetical protein n=1 Tax=Jiangella muralis TaxID=702383 RepID=UPI0012F78581|nr:hypothetical protein [Jiangella muralis]